MSTIQNEQQIHLPVARLVHADGYRQTETIKLIGAFRDTANAPKMEYNEKYINLAHDVDQWWGRGGGGGEL
jgi:hypothetical protein